MDYTLTSIKLQDKTWDETPPKLYLCENYNVLCFYLSNIKNSKPYLARVYSVLVEALNESLRLPRYILVMLDRDLIANADLYDYGVSCTIKDTLKWILINTNHAIEKHKLDLIRKRKGAVSSASEPRLIWITMLKRPDYSMNKRIFSLARKFNNILEDVIAGNKRSHILKVHVDHTRVHFDRNGYLTPAGRIAYWKYIDSEMSKFDRGQTELKPIKSTVNSAHAVTAKGRPRQNEQVHHNNN